MEDKRFDEPVDIFIDGGHDIETVRSAAAAAHHLLKAWPVKPGPRHRKARQALLDLFEGTATPQQAREAFERAADEAEIRIGGWHAKNPLAAFISKQKGIARAPVPRAETEMTEPGWRKTSEDQDKDEDYVYIVDGDMKGRIYLHDTGGIMNGKWRWFFGGSSGVSESRREAMLAVELAYEGSQPKQAL